jgi:hypothetical protein
MAHPMAAAGPVADSEHLPNRATYACTVCQEPWPCPPARVELATTHDRVQLAIIMWGELELAIPQLVDAGPERLFDRFLRWTE